MMEGIDQERVEAADKSIKARDKWLIRTVIGLAVCQIVGILLLGGTAVWVVINDRETDRQLCRSTADSRDSLRDAFKRAKSEAISGAETADETQFIISFFNVVLSEIPPIRCTPSGEPEEPSLAG